MNRQLAHEVDFCVIGGGLAGMFAAIAAARHGAKVAIIQDRPVFGGNASSEIRMWVCGAHGENNKETGLLEEMFLENRHRNPYANYSLWDSVLYEMVRFEPNITMLLNCSCHAAEMDGSRIESVTGWQLTTYTEHTVNAKLFADCSGDSILAPLTGAEFRLGREAAGEFDEDIAPDVTDEHTMGLTCLLEFRQTLEPRPFIPPAWAYEYLTCADLPQRFHALKATNNFWWLEIGGMADTIHDTEAIRDELLKIAFGVWDHIKNHCPDKDKAAHWELDWIGFLPGKRESRRYVGDHIMTQNDVRSEGRFDDIVAYGGWAMDDHHPAGFEYEGAPTIFHPAPSPYGIPYRCLYSKNVDNLYFAGRNMSATHTAMSSTRTMATCAVMGQAVGTAAALACREGLRPRDIYTQGKVAVVQDMLQADDCYIPWRRRVVSPLTQQAKLTTAIGPCEALRNGYDRPIDGQDNGWVGRPGHWIEFRFQTPRKVQGLRIIFDSDLNRLLRLRETAKTQVLNDDNPVGINTQETRVCYPLRYDPIGVPDTLVKEFAVLVEGEPGQWRECFTENNNYQRFRTIDLNVETTAVRLVPQKTRGADRVRIFSVDVW